ncbi:Hypothetical predicted protein, partial [Paramuricea clavata]
MAKVCMKGSSCEVTGCNRKHLTLLHPPRQEYPKRRAERDLPGPTNEENEHLEDGNPEGGNCNATNRGCGVRLRTVPGRNSDKEGIVISIATAEDIEHWKHLSGIGLHIIEDKEVRILIGSDVPEAFWVLEERSGGRGEPYAIRLVGPTEPVEDRENQFSTNFIRVGMEEETLQQRTKRNKVQRNLVSGDLVLVVEENVHRGQWALGRVTVIYTEKDGRVRSAKIMTRSTTLEELRFTYEVRSLGGSTQNLSFHDDLYNQPWDHIDQESNIDHALLHSKNECLYKRFTKLCSYIRLVAARDILGYRNEHASGIVEQNPGKPYPCSLKSIIISLFNHDLTNCKILYVNAEGVIACLNKVLSTSTELRLRPHVLNRFRIVSVLIVRDASVHEAVKLFSILMNLESKHGFTPGKSSTTQLIQVIDTIVLSSPSSTKNDTKLFQCISLNVKFRQYRLDSSVLLLPMVKYTFIILFRLLCCGLSYENEGRYEKALRRIYGIRECNTQQCLCLE